MFLWAKLRLLLLTKSLILLFFFHFVLFFNVVPVLLSELTVIFYSTAHGSCNYSSNALGSFDQLPCFVNESILFCFAEFAHTESVKEIPKSFFTKVIFQYLIFCFLRFLIETLFLSSFKHHSSVHVCVSLSLSLCLSEFFFFVCYFSSSIRHIRRTKGITRAYKIVSTLKFQVAPHFPFY